jgi:hypothetical protein
MDNEVSIKALQEFASDGRELCIILYSKGKSFDACIRIF